MGPAHEPAGGKRLRQVVAVLTRHGLSSLAALFAADGNVAGRWVGLRLAFEELGTTFVKLGQILSTRGDLLPPDYQAELARLQDGAPPEPAEVIRDAVEAELGRPVGEVFESFDDEPLASASIGQAHAAVLADRAALRADLLGLAQSYVEQPLGDVSLAALLRDLLSVGRRHHLHLPANLALLVKTIAMCEGVGAQLDPGFRMIDVLLPFVQRLVAEHPDA